MTVKETSRDSDRKRDKDSKRLRQRHHKKIWQSEEEAKQIRYERDRDRYRDKDVLVCISRAR